MCVSIHIGMCTQWEETFWKLVGLLPLVGNHYAEEYCCQGSEWRKGQEQLPKFYKTKSPTAIFKYHCGPTAQMPSDSQQACLWHCWCPAPSWGNRVAWVCWAWGQVTRTLIFPSLLGYDGWPLMPKFTLRLTFPTLRRRTHLSLPSWNTIRCGFSTSTFWDRYVSVVGAGVHCRMLRSIKWGPGLTISWQIKPIWQSKQSLI